LSAAVFASAPALGVPQQQAGLAGGVLNTAMEFGPTVLFAVLLTLGSDASPPGRPCRHGPLLKHRTK
jgi:hypothetical protein